MAATENVRQLSQSHNSTAELIVPRHSVVTLFGYGIQVRVDRGHLVLEDGRGERVDVYETRSFAPTPLRSSFKPSFFSKYSRPRQRPVPHAWLVRLQSQRRSVSALSEFRDRRNLERAWRWIRSKADTNARSRGYERDRIRECG